MVDGVAVEPDRANDTLREPVPGGRRDRRRQHSVQGAEDEPASDPVTPDPAVLAQQQALAARAADLTYRAQRAQEVASQPRIASEDPTTTHSLAVLASPEFFHRTTEPDAEPGTDPPVTPANPATPEVPAPPVLTSSGSFPQGIDAPEPTTSSPGIAGPTGATSTTATPSAPSMPAPVPSRSPDQHTSPVEARSAFGLQPLDAMTAGLGRLRRLRYLQYSLLGVGAAALCTGIIMIVSSLNG